MKNKWLLIPVTLLIVLSLSLSACAPAATEAPAPEEPAPEEPAPEEPAPEEPAPEEPAPEPEEPAEPKTATMTFFEEPDTLSELYSSMWFGTITFDLFQLSFWQFDDEGNVSLELATEFPTMENGLISEDGLTITIPLREGVVWSDGTPVTAHDYVFTTEMIMAEENAVQTRYPNDTFVESVTALDDYTVEIVMNEPYVGWAVGLDWNFIPEHVLRPVFEAEGTIDNAAWNRDQSVTNGPFKLKEWEATSHLILEANDDYWRGRPILDQLFIRIVPDDEAQMAAIKTGDTDIGVFLSAADQPDIEELPDVELVGASSGYVESWWVNLISE
jgi:peptide/nickel transport system substrate-binding protein